MKRIYSLLLFASLLFLAASCVQELDRTRAELLSTEGKVPIIMSFTDDVPLQASTKATAGMQMGLDPAIKTIHVAVFGSSGYLKDYTSAIPCDSEGNTLSGFTENNAETAYFKVYLPFDEEPSNRRIHIIANGPSSLPFNAYEDEIIKNLTVSNGNGAYWTRFVTDKTQGEGILAEEDASGNLVATQGTVALFQNLKLIRNFASITVQKNEVAENNFDILGFAVCNMPSEGAVAIYNESSSEWIPGSLREKQEIDGKVVYNEIADSGYAGLTMPSSYLLSYNGTPYPGFPLSPRLDTYIPPTDAAFGGAGISEMPGHPIYIYERAKTSNTAPFVLIKARFEEEGTEVTSTSPVYYYRLDITPGNNYVPFYRNFKYFIKIKAINVAGSETPAEAAKRNSGDNFSVSLDTQALPYVSNGTTRLYVQQTDFASLYSAETKSFWYQFFVEGVGIYNNTAAQGGDVIDNPASMAGTTAITVEETETGALASWSVGAADADDSDHKRFISYTLNEPTEGHNLTSVLRITGTYTPSDGNPITIVRDVRITVLSPKTISAWFSPNPVGPDAGENTRLYIEIPTDLTRGMFPMIFKIEDSSLSLNPDEAEVPVKPGPSIIKTDPQDNAYQFYKTLNWSTYQELLEDAILSGKPKPVVSVAMKTIKDNTETTAYIANEYFSTVNAPLSIDPGNFITPGDTLVNYKEHSGANALKFRVFAGGPWILAIALENGSAAIGATLSVASGSITGTSGQAVTVTLPANPGTRDRVYILTLQRTDVDNITRTATIIQEGRLFTLSTASASLESSASVKGNTTTYDLTLKSEFENWDIAIDEGASGCSLSPTSAPTTGDKGVGTFTVRLTMPINYTTEDVTHIIKATASDGTERRVTVVQRGASKGTERNTGTINCYSNYSSTGSNKAYTYNYTNSGNTYSITGTFSSITERTYVGTNRIGVPDESKLTFSVSPTTVMGISRVVFDYYLSSYSPSSVTWEPSGSMNSGYTEWTGDVLSSDTPLEFTFHPKSGNNVTAIISWRVYYYMYKWE